MRLATAFLLTLTACGHSGGVTADQACTDQANARCGQLVACSRNGMFDLLRAYPDMNTCITRVKLACTNGLTAPSTGNSPATVEKCATALKALSCGDFLDSIAPADCIVSGTLANGASCYGDAQCMSSVCLIAKGMPCGTCQPQPAAGADCATTGCGHNLACPAASMTCVVLGQMGAACDRNNPCASGFSCVGANMAMNLKGACQTAGATVGAPCDPNAKMMPYCDTTSGLTCNTSLNCVAEVLSNDNGACGRQTSDGSFISCAAGGACYPLGTLSGTCRTAAADGAACDTVLGPPCLNPARCVASGGATNGTCQIVDPSSCK